MKFELVCHTPARVVHCKRESFDVYIGRPGIWGNPFVVDVDGTREEVIEKYRGYVLNTPWLLTKVPNLQGKVLGCWCSPKPCHGDVLVELAEGGDYYVDKDGVGHMGQSYGNATRED